MSVVTATPSRAMLEVGANSDKISARQKIEIDHMQEEERTSGGQKDKKGKTHTFRRPRPEEIAAPMDQTLAGIILRPVVGVVNCQKTQHSNEEPLDRR